MGEILVIKGPGNIGFDMYEERALQPGEVRLNTLYSGISAGTQLTLYRGKNPYVEKKWNPDLRIFEEREEEGSMYPVKGAWGYEEVGQVAEIAKDVKNVMVGDIIYGTWSHKSTHITSEEFAFNHRLKEGMDPIVGIYSQMGAIALNAILDADIHIGETVAVFGQGVPGQLVLQMAKLNGARVVAVDLDDGRLAYSEKFGADHVMNPLKCDAARAIKELTEGRGADIAIEISGADAALHEAVRSVAYNGTVVCSGFIQEGASRLFLGEEFHHNRIQIVCSQIQEVNPVLNRRWDRLRMERTVMEFAAYGKIDLKGLVTHVVPFREAAGAYDMLDSGEEKCLQVVLDFTRN